ncbi:electron transport complex subunit RsxC [Alteromonas ponticola]|uniref:Ion-translocating oxidoreductase complex subunit C n=1 Tax=Alteromonas aquimaris TaxID=2998417 RepID=A0ABT3P4Q7_9ALTE|nr:electron transport complex subunit RsxC [Alteromonas aquimaris]MCW8107754.1 electron transport complex subunit RsxC [Alteromonas aquimaris]
MIRSTDEIIAELKEGRCHSFTGGVHPPDEKSLSNTTKIQTLPLPETIILPLRQHIGTEGSICVAEGDYVKKGQALTKSSHPFAVPVHASTSGTVKRITPHVVAHPSGLSEPCIIIEPDGQDEWTTLTPLPHFQSLPQQTVVEAICDAGIAGMGGAGFPTHIKTGNNKKIEFLIINGAECEPYITSDDRLMQEHAWQIRQGIDVLQHLITPMAVVIAIEDNKPEAIKAMQIACQDKPGYLVVAVETKYPAGGEKQLIQMLTQREVPRHGLPADIGVLMFNVGTCFAVASAIYEGKPLIERVVTVSGRAVKQPGNYWARLGTPVKHLLANADYQVKEQSAPQIVMGGPMMGFTLSSMAVPIVKISNCLLAPAKGEVNFGEQERACIRCGACADACPASLLPQQIFWHAKAKELDKAQSYNLFDCIECGACAYVCPSEIPLVHYYRQAKAEIRLEKEEKSRAEKAKERFEARNARLIREKQEREERHQKAKAAREAAANQKTSEPVESNAAKDKVAAALARAKAKKAAQQSTPSDSATSAEINKKTQVAAAIARAKAKKEAALTDASDTDNVSAEDERKAKIAAAVARAKAKKEAAQADASDTGNESAEDERKAKIAAAVARAKAKKEAAQADASDTGNDSAEDERKAKIAAAVARAKAKKEAAQTDASDTGNISAEDERKAKIAAAVARAKVKKEAAQADASDNGNDSAEDERTVRTAAAVVQINEDKHSEEASLPADTSFSANEPSSDSEQASLSEDDEKRKRIAAAVAKAKAKKIAQKNNSETE